MLSIFLLNIAKRTARGTMKSSIEEVVLCESSVVDEETKEGGNFGPKIHGQIRAHIGSFRILLCLATIAYPSFMMKLPNDL